MILICESYGWGMKLYVAQVKHFPTKDHMDGLAQDCSNSIADTGDTALLH